MNHGYDGYGNDDMSAVGNKMKKAARAREARAKAESNTPAPQATKSDAEKGSTGGQDNSKFVNAMSKAGAAGMAGSSGGAMDTAGNALMMTGEPTTMAAGAALKVVSSISDKRLKERQARANAENARRSKLMNAMSGLGQGIGSTGMA